MNNVYGPLTILGDTEVGDTLLIRDNAVGDPDGIVEESKVYTWHVNGVVIEIGSKSLIVTEDMQGSTISASMHFQDRAGNEEMVITSERSMKHIPYTDKRMKTLNVLYTYLLKRRPDYKGLKFWAGVLEKLENEGHPTALAKTIEEFQTSDGYKKELGL